MASSALVRLFGLFWLTLVVACGGGDYAASSPSSGGGNRAQSVSTDSYESDGAYDDIDLVEGEAAAAEMPADVGGAAPPMAPPPPPAPSPNGASIDPDPPAPVSPKDTKKIEHSQSGSAQPAPNASAPRQVAGPLLIYQADLQLRVDDSAKTLEATEELAKGMGGYLVRRNDREIVIRVPARKFDDAMKTLTGFGEVLHRNVEVEDVTERFYALTVRLKNARAVRARFQQLLLEAKTVQDSLAIERELERVTEKIERMEGKLKLLKELIAFSTITLRVHSRRQDKIRGVTLPFPWLRELGLPKLLSM